MPVAMRSGHAPAVAKRWRQAGNEDVPVAAGAVLVRVELDFPERLSPFQRVEHEPDRCPVTAQHDKIDSLGQGGRPQGERPAAGRAEV